MSPFWRAGLPRSARPRCTCGRCNAGNCHTRRCRVLRDAQAIHAACRSLVDADWLLDPLGIRSEGRQDQGRISGELATLGGSPVPAPVTQLTQLDTTVSRSAIGPVVAVESVVSAVTR